MSFYNQNIKIYALSRNEQKLKARFKNYSDKEYFIPIIKDVRNNLDIEEVDRVYTTNINYIDKDGQRDYAIIYTEVLETKFGDDIDTNIRVQDGSLYLLYMSSCDLFNKDHKFSRKRYSFPTLKSPG